MIAYLGLGSNLGDRLSYLQGAVAALRRLDPDLRVSPVYETAPVGGPADQGPYLNAVVELSTSLTPHELLALGQRLEQDAGRVRTVRYGARTLDVDVLLLDDLTIDDPDLVVPHPRLEERAFVLAPLEDLAPDLVPRGWRTRVPRADRLGDDLRELGTLLA